MFISFFMGNLVFIELSHRTPDWMISPEGAVLTVKKTYGNSGTPEPAASPVVPHFPNPPDFRGHNSEKCGIGPELFNDFRRKQMKRI